MMAQHAFRSLTLHSLTLAAVGALACSGISLPTDPDSLGGASATGGGTTQAGATALGGGGSGTITQPESGGTPATGGASSVPPCAAPNYSSDCSKVPTFQCGPSVTCDGTTFRMQWHEHVGCARSGQTGLYDTIFSYVCTYPCAKAACELVDSWPSNGSVIAQACDSNH